MVQRWSPQQDNALKAASRWLSNRDTQVFRLFGFAGTGKTTLATHLAEGVDGLVCFAAFTGKAALVMRSRGCSEARTIHSLIYRPRDIDTEEPSFVLNADSDAASAQLIIIDECSMVDEELGAISCPSESPFWFWEILRNCHRSRAAVFLPKLKPMSC